MNEIDETLEKHLIWTMMPLDEVGCIIRLHIIRDTVCSYTMLSDAPRPDSEQVTVQAIAWQQVSGVEVTVSMFIRYEEYRIWRDLFHHLKRGMLRRSCECLLNKESFHFSMNAQMLD